MSKETPGNSLFEKMPAELKNGRLEALSTEIKASLQLMIDADIRTGGEVTTETREAITTQGYEYLNGRLKKLDTLTAFEKKTLEIEKI